MSKFIKLTLSNDKSVYINVENVTAVLPFLMQNTVTAVYCCGDEFEVKESYETIIELIEKKMKCLI